MNIYKQWFQIQGQLYPSRVIHLWMSVIKTVNKSEGCLTMIFTCIRLRYVWYITCIPLCYAESYGDVVQPMVYNSTISRHLYHSPFCSALCIHFALLQTFQRQRKTITLMCNWNRCPGAKCYQKLSCSKLEAGQENVYACPADSWVYLTVTGQILSALTSEVG